MSEKWGATDPYAGCRLMCDTHRSYLIIPDNQGAASTSLVQCTRCGLVIESPRPAREAIDAFYANAGLWTGSKDAEGRPRSYVRELEMKRPQFDDLVRRIERYKRRGRLLDVGAGAGLLEKSLDLTRWIVTGVERSQYIAEFGQRNLHTHVVHATFESVDLPASSFDVVVLKYVLDHMEAPFEALVKARRLLKPDGLLVLADLINIDSFCARFFAEGHRLFHPMHFTYFSPRTIQFHLERAGFRVIRVEFPFFRTPYFNWSNVMTLIRRVIQRATTRALGRREKVFSAACYGNMMDVWAVPGGSNE